MLTYVRTYAIINVRTNQGGAIMSVKGRPTDDKKDKRFEIRLSSSTYDTLTECSEKLKISKSQVIHRGIELVKSELDKK